MRVDDLTVIVALPKRWNHGWKVRRYAGGQGKKTATAWGCLRLIEKHLKVFYFSSKGGYRNDGLVRRFCVKDGKDIINEAIHGKELDKVGSPSYQYYYLMYAMTCFLEDYLSHPNLIHRTSFYLKQMLKAKENPNLPIEDFIYRKRRVDQPLRGREA